MLNFITVLAPHLGYALPMGCPCVAHALPMRCPCAGCLLRPVGQYLLKIPHPAGTLVTISIMRSTPVAGVVLTPRWVGGWKCRRLKVRCNLLQVQDNAGHDDDRDRHWQWSKPTDA